MSQSRATAGVTNLKVAGSGFAPTTQVVIHLAINGTTVSQPYWSVDTSASGTFSAVIPVPSYLAPGSYSVVATDAYGNTASASLTIAAPQPNPLTTLGTFIYLIFFVVLFFFQTQLQSMIYRSQIEKAVRTLDSLEKESFDMVRQAALQGGASNQEVDRLINESLETFTIEPVDRDPTGVLSRLDHILDVRNIRSKGDAKKIAPNYNGPQLMNFEVSLEAAWATHYVDKVVKHFYLTAKKTNNFYLFLQLSMMIPMIVEIAKIYKRATKHFLLGVPIGDSVGPMVALTLLNGAPLKDIEEDTVYGETQLEQRRIVVVKAKGPGATVGKPGKAIAKLVEMYKEGLSRIITVDAALKLEGEKTGTVAEGVGAAIGDPGPEKYAIENSATTLRVPLEAVIIKQSEEDAITAMKKDIVDAVPSVVERVKKIVLERTKPGDTVIVAGIGNTAGVP
ncbi:MAG: DUF1512 family protein [Candidatus Marsarchaeota archaeon]|nr:DUF1512 family protein [Candidatus Marsarchaeota archaeon]